MATVTIGLLLSGWLTPAPGRAQPGQPDPDPGLEKCTNCVNGSVVLSAPTNAPAGCVGSPISIVAGISVNPAQVTIILTNKDGSTTNLASYQLDPTYNVTWTMSGVGANTNNGTGTTATFTPTNSGCGTVAFTAYYTNQTPCGGAGSSAASGSFSVGQLYTNCFDGAFHLGASASTTNLSFGPGANVSLTVTNNNFTNAIWVTTHYSCGTNVDTYGPTNFVRPTILSNWWTLNFGGLNTNGTGQSVSFTPTNGGCGTVTFNLTYKNNTPCDTNVHNASLALIFGVAQLSTNCTSGMFVLGASSSITNLNFGPGAGVNLSVTNNSFTNSIVVTTLWPSCVTNANASATNFVSPIILSNWWTASVGGYSTNGTGRSASFTPTNGGCGSVTFNLAYINNTPCDTNVYRPSLTLNFAVAQLYTNCTTGIVALGNSSATTNFCFGIVASLAVTNNNITNAIVVTTQWPSCSTNVNTSVTNFVTPTIFSNTWTLTFGSFNTNGNGMSASFTPTNAGSGTVTFNEYYTNNTPCDTNAHSASVAVPFNVIQLTSTCEATTPTNQDRLTIGVGEKVDLTLAGGPSSTTWAITSGGGRLNPTTGTSPIFTAPFTNDNCTVVASYPGSGGCSVITFNVKEPSGYIAITNSTVGSWIVKGVTNLLPNVSGTGMHIDLWLAPTNVSFGAVLVMEVGENATNITGYFTSNAPPSHIGNGADKPVQVGPDNKIGQDTAALAGLPQPWSDGRFTWPIPALWWLPGSSSNSLPWSDQVFIIDASGTMTITKFGHTVTRNTNDVYTTFN
jgi:hypothetical protein